MSRLIGIIVFLCCSALLVSVTLAQSAETLETTVPAGELLRTYERSLNAFQKSTFRATVKSYYVSGSDMPPGTLYRDSTLQYWRKGNHWKVFESADLQYMNKVTGKLQQSKGVSEMIYPGDGCISLSLDTKVERPVAILVEEKVTGERDRTAGLREFSPAVDGRLQGLEGYSLFAVLRDCNVVAKKEILKDEEMLVLEGDVPKIGHLRVWLDPIKGCLPRRIATRKGRQDETDEGVTLGSFRNGIYQELRLEFEAKEFSIIEGQPVITKMVVTDDWMTTDGKHEVTRREASLSDIKFNPDFSTDPFVPSVKIRNGFPVTVFGQEQIAHEWRDGRVVKSVHQPSVDNLEGNQFQKRSRFGRGRLVFTGVSLVSLLGIVAVWSWWRFRRAITRA